MGRHMGNLPDYDYAAELRQRLASASWDVPTAVRLAWMRGHGEGGDPDYWRAAHDYGRLALHYRNTIRSKTARNLYLALQHLHLGLHYETGRSDSPRAPDPDPAEAQNQYREARKRLERAIKKDPKQNSINKNWEAGRSPAELAEAQVELAFLFETGRGGETDVERGAELRLAAAALWP